ncbi:hypothetical protein E2C01_090964 [Portunus trituberculatus]|uniref:Uncharacterized protein n=1 Tax=Portunus trituberculatus TaxID=210409 RepID=A0A5B7JLT0_PORTR|nr:hypothetical protein [Portunus trituberculatus]
MKDSIVWDDVGGKAVNKDGVCGLKQYIGDGQFSQQAPCRENTRRSNHRKSLVTLSTQPLLGEHLDVTRTSKRNQEVTLRDKL